MKYLKLFKNKSSAIGKNNETPFIGIINNDSKVSYASKDIGDKIKIISNKDDDDFFDIQEYKTSIIKYSSSEKLVDTYSDYNDGFHINAFGDAIILSHTFENGEGVITFNNLNEIGDYAFSGCTELTNIIIPNNISGIGDVAFAGCTELTNIIIPDNITRLGSGAFAGCTELKSVIISNNINNIEMETFRDCYSLESINIHDGIKNIGYEAFSGCVRLNDIFIPNDIESIDYNAFYNVPNVIYSGNIDISDCGALHICIKNNILNNQIIYKASNKLLETIGEYTNGLHMNAFNAIINTHTFENGKGIITFNKDLTNIGYNAFSGCKEITNIIIPNSVTHIGVSAFNNCTLLKFIYIPESVNKIDKCAFNNLQEVIYNGTANGSPWGALNIKTN